MTSKSYSVRAVHCDHRASDEEVYQQLKRATAPLTRSWDRLRKAKTIAIKFNQDFPPHRVTMIAGQRQALVSDSVARAVLRLLRENTTAHLITVDSSFHVVYDGEKLEATTHLAPIFREFDVEYVNGHVEQVHWHETPGGGRMFRRYPLSRRLTDADERVSVQKMKNHAFMGVTLCLKNLFGLMPAEPLGRPRHYYHHLVRMPYMLADIGQILDPALNIIDALVGQAKEEWGDGKGNGRIVNGLVAGDHIIATDACGAYLMGHDPAADWLTPPFHRDRNALLVAAQSGFGTVNLNEIDFASELEPQAPGVFYSDEPDSRQTVINWRRTMCEQGLFYRDHAQQYRQYAGQYILIQDDAVRWHDPSGRLTVSRRKLSGAYPDHSLWFKYVDPDDVEGEHYDVYEQVLKAMQSQAL